MNQNDIWLQSGDVADFLQMDFWIHLPKWAKHTIVAAFVGVLLGEIRHMIRYMVKVERLVWSL
jgi:hypothetical protein